MIFNMVGGGGGSGATLVVSSPANVSVTVSKDDKSYTKNSGSLGSTTFKGLATGTWTVTISGNGQTATKTIEITADYAITIAFFSAAINITYPANSNCVVKNSGGTTVASDTNTGSSTKTWTATVGATGTYTVTATATDGSGKTKSTTVSITTDGQSESVTLSYELYLYKNGDKCTDVGGDWSLRKGYAEGVSVSYKTDYAQLNVAAETNQYMGNGFWYKNLDITNYSKLCAIVTYNTVANSGKLMIAVCNSATDTPISTNVARKDIGANDVSATVPIELDISSITGSKYIGIGTHMAETGSGIAKIKEVYLV